MAKHESISRELRAEISSGAFGPANRLPSEAQLVERFGVSRPTVTRALRDLQTEGLIERRAGSGTYVVENSSKPLQTQVLGLLIPELSSTEIFQAICGELGALARGNGYGLLWGGSPTPYAQRDSSPEHAIDVCQQFIQKNVAGVFFAPLEYHVDKDKVNYELLDQLRKSGTPVVLLDRDVAPFPQRSTCDLVTLDNFAAGFMIGEHLIRLGCTKIRFAARPGSAATVEARISGVREAIVRNGHSVSSEFAVFGDPEDQKFVRGFKADRACDAIVCANDLTAAKLIKTLTEIQVEVPDQVSVVGFDDVRYASLLTVPLTSIAQPCREIAQLAFRLMIERINEPGLPSRMISVAPRLVVRDSCGAYQR